MNDDATDAALRAVEGDPIAHARKLLDLLGRRMISLQPPGLLELPLATALRVLVVHCEQIDAAARDAERERIRQQLLDVVCRGASQGNNVVFAALLDAIRDLAAVPGQPQDTA